MILPTIAGVIRRRILLNYRADPQVVQRVLPACFSPVVVNDKAVAGICLIRLEQIRPAGLPSFIGVTSENAAHRIAVMWTNAKGQSEYGVYIPRRDTSSRLVSLAGGRVFSGVHHLARFDVTDTHDQVAMRVVQANTKQPLVEFTASATTTFPEQSIFESLAASSSFFEQGCVGYSPRRGSCMLDGLKLQTRHWKVSPLAVRQVNSSFYDDSELFPAGSITFDHALIMRDIPHKWLEMPELAEIPTQGEAGR